MESITEVLAILGGSAAMLAYVEKKLCKKIDDHLSDSRRIGMSIVSRVSLLEAKTGSTPDDIIKRNEELFAGGETKN